MYKRIVMVVDSGVEMEFVADYALLIAKLSGAKFFLVPAYSDEEVTSTIRSIEDRAEAEGIETEILSIEEDVIKGINKLVKDRKLDLILISLKGERDGRFFIGTLAQRLMKHAKASVIGVRIVKARAITHHRKLLVPVSNREYHFKERLFLIRGISRSLSLNVSLFRCIKSRDKTFDRDEMKAIFEDSREYLAPLSEGIGEGGIRTDVRVRVCDNATDGILDEAMAGRFDLLLVRAVKRNVVKEFLSGNEVEEIIRRTPSNLLLWKSRE